MIAPFNRADLLLGIFFSNIVLISVPFTLIIILNLIVYPISVISLLFVLGIYCLIALIFSGIGIAFGVFAISNENVLKVLNFLIGFVYLFSCLTFPFQIFPDFIQNVIVINPLYYVFDFLRMSWINNNVALTITNYPFHFLILISCAIILPIVGTYIFSKVYKKYGITGF